MSLPFLARRLDEIAFGPVWSLVRVPPIANLLPEEMPVYTQLKMLFMDIPRLKVLHDTPPLRGFQPLHSLSLPSTVRSPHKQHFSYSAFSVNSWSIFRDWAPVLSYFSADLTHHPPRLLCTFHAPATTHIPAGS
jgi:hypothetical protein